MANTTHQDTLTATIAAWLHHKVDLPADRAAAAAGQLAAAWSNHDLDFDTACDAAGDHLADDDPRPGDFVDDLAAHVGLKLED